MNEAVKLLKNARKIAIFTHQRPDGDALGSVCALSDALVNIGKEAFIFLDDTPGNKYAFMFEGRQTAPSDFTPDLVVSVDTGDINMLGSSLELFGGRVDLCIDHHKSNTGYAKYTWVDENAAAAGEMVFKIIGELGISISDIMARDLYISISTDTGCFSYSNTSAETFRIASELTKIHGSFGELNHNIFDSINRKQLEAQKCVLETLEYYVDGRVASIVISNEMRDKTGVTEEETDNFSQLPRRIEGVEVGVTFKENGAGWRISMRSNLTVDVSSICMEFGGGGHKRAAGATVKGELCEVKKAVLAAVFKAMDL